MKIGTKGGASATVSSADNDDEDEDEEEDAEDMEGNKIMMNTLEFR